MWLGLFQKNSCFCYTVRVDDNSFGIMPKPSLSFENICILESPDIQSTAAQISTTSKMFLFKKDNGNQ